MAQLGGSIPMRESDPLKASGALPWKLGVISRGWSLTGMEETRGRRPMAREKRRRRIVSPQRKLSES